MLLNGERMARGHSCWLAVYTQPWNQVDAQQESLRLGLYREVAAFVGDGDAAGPSIDDSTILFGPDAHTAPAPAPAAPSASNTLASLLASNSTLAAQLALSPGQPPRICCVAGSAYWSDG